MGKKFNAVFESAMSRYQRGGFLVGDVVKFEDNFKSTESYKKLGTNVQELVDKMIDSGLNVRVVGSNSKYPSGIPGVQSNAPGSTSLDIALDLGGGRYVHYCTIPSELVQPLDIYPNLPPIPDAVKRKDKINIKPEELETDDNPSNMSDRGNGKLTQTEIELPTSNTTIPSKSADESPDALSYTHQYLPKK